MRVAKLTELQTLTLCEEPFAEKPGEGEVVLQVKAVGICGTDIHIFKAGRADVQLPRVMGHELSGVVAGVGAGVSHLKEGDRVVLDPVFACGGCSACRKGHRNVCASVRCYGVQMDGGFRDFIRVPAAQVYPIPDKISFAQAALAEPFSIAANILERAGGLAGESLVIMGSGTIGLALLQAAKGMDMRVLVGDIVPAKLELAKRFGADRTVDMREDFSKAAAAFAPDGADIIVDAVGTAGLFEQSVRLAPPTGRVVSIGFDGALSQIPAVDITKKELTIAGSRMNNSQFSKVVRWLEEEKIQPGRMITASYPLERIQDAFEDAASGGNIKVMVTF